jgi:hypothetical protein
MSTGTYLKEAQTLLLEMNHKFKDICSLTEEDCYHLHAPSSLRSVLSNKLFHYANCQGPIMDAEDNSKILALSYGSDGQPVTVEKFEIECKKLTEQIDKEDEFVCNTVDEYNNKFKEIAMNNNITVGALYQQLNAIASDSYEQSLPELEQEEEEGVTSGNSEA